ncbi:MAG: hypothetical protein EB012_12290 [Gammaproteobacteria bacterium]|nr:hypothetical protein [Gammaproteobacteria bacterium]
MSLGNFRRLRHIHRVLNHHGLDDLIPLGHLPAFLEAARASASKETLKSSELSIEGSLQTAQDVQHLSRVLNIDWQRFLARYLGYRVAGSVLSTLRSGREHVRESFLALETDLSEYLREEVRLLPQKHHTETPKPSPPAATFSPMILLKN